MPTVKNCLAHKTNRIVSVRPDDMVVAALQAMRDNRVRAVLVLESTIPVPFVGVTE